ncbi:MAG TPA: diaminopimelate decarboxylase [Actinomycetota bacterium]|nr:diaminopimelate decarboxylase [Actinomycetota bacterium]
MTGPWWVRPGLEARDGRLRIAGRDAEELAREHATPLYVYDLHRIEEQARRLQDALARASLRHRVRLALKAQRAPEALAVLRGLGPPGEPRSVGIDACSPRELLLALEHGWRPEEISYTGTNVSDRDLEVVLAHPVHVNVDLLSQLERFGRRAPGRAVGLRVNPRAGAGGQTYSGEQPTKFGIYDEDLDRALEVARRHDLTIDTVHFHVGRAFLTDSLPGYERAVIAAAAMARRLVEAGMPIREVNVGGGLGVPQRAGDRPLDLDALAGMLARHLGPLDVVVACEPGDFLTKECGHLLAEVVTVEDRAGVTFVGVDAGFTVMPEHFIYGAPVEVVLCRAAEDPDTTFVTVAGNINEGDDLLAEDVPLPSVEEGDVLAMLNVGSYNAVMTMEHCLRPPAASVFFTDRA